MEIGNLTIGKRRSHNHKFCFFYCPLISPNRKPYWFFWWFGYNWYVCLEKSKYKDK